VPLGRIIAVMPQSPAPGETGGARTR